MKKLFIATIVLIVFSALVISYDNRGAEFDYFFERDERLSGNEAVHTTEDNGAEREDQEISTAKPKSEGCFSFSNILC